MMHSLPRLAAACLCLAVPVAAQRLIAIDSSRALYELDMTTGQRTQIGTVSTNASTTAGLAYDAISGNVYLTSTGNDSLYTLDLTTGNATLVGAYGNSALVMHGLEWDASTSTLYGVSSHDNGLYTIDTTTGLATLVGTSGLTSFSNLVHDSLNNVMYSTNSGTDSFYVMDRTTGTTTLVGPLLGPTNPNGLAYNSDTDTIYLVCNNTDTLYTINRQTGQTTVVGAYGSSNFLGLVYLPADGIARVPHGCGTATIQSVGNTAAGGTVTTTLGNTTGLPFLGLGLAVFPNPFCTCTLGHEWSIVLFGTTNVLTLPLSPAYTGLQIGIQGADLLGVGGCPAPAVALTDTMVVTIR
ncbi:MAG: hypothetical protein JNK49_07230 [Planctomycetes bacterium]|nr:hypothetical protein [Planctomycetota bacterium]